MGTAPPDRDLSDTERQSVISGSGAKSGTFEQNPQLIPSRARGMHPNPGLFEVDKRRDPIIATALWRRAMSAASRTWLLPDRDDFDATDKARAESARDMIDEMPGGMSGLVRRIFTRDQFGFSVFERWWRVDPDTLEWRLRDVVWMHPSTVRVWGLNEAGFMVGFWQRSERGLVWIDREKLSHFVREDTGRNPEGVSALRPVHWYIEAKGEIVSTYIASLHLFGEGWMDVLTSTRAGSPERQALENALRSWQSGKNRYLIHNSDTEVEPKHGGTVMPELEPILRTVDGQSNRGLDEAAQGLAQSPFGAKALGVELNRSTDKAMGGEYAELCSLIRSEVIVPYYQRNEWDPKRAPYVIVRGAGGDEDLARGRVLLEMVRDGVIPEDRKAEVVTRGLELLDL